MARFQKNMPGQQLIDIFERDHRESTLTDVVRYLKDMENQFGSMDTRTFVNSAICQHCDEIQAVQKARIEYTQNHRMVSSMIEDGRKSELIQGLRNRGFTDDAVDRHIAQFSDDIDYHERSSEYDHEEARGCEELRQGIVFAVDSGIDVDHRTISRVSEVTDASMTHEAAELSQFMGDYTERHHEMVFAGKVPMVSAPRVDLTRIMSPEPTPSLDLSRDHPFEYERDVLSGSSLKRSEVGVVQASDTVRAFMAAHGRNPDGTRMNSQQSEQDREME